MITANDAVASNAIKIDTSANRQRILCHQRTRTFDIDRFGGVYWLIMVLAVSCE
jgi:hypothetical protein